MAQIVDTSAWVTVSAESAGADEKRWVSTPADASSGNKQNWWVFKAVKYGVLTDKETGGPVPYRRSEDRAEWLAARLAPLLGVPAAEVELANDGQDEGVISRNVTPLGWELFEGDSLMAEFPDYVPCGGKPKMRERPGHSLENIQELLRDVGGPPETLWANDQGFDVFIGYMVFDAWIANTDRHALNWGLVASRQGVGLAKSFDHGSALASGLDATARAKQHRLGAARFAAKGKAHRFEGGRSTKLVDYALRGVEMAGAAGRQWLERLGDVPDDAWDALLADVYGVSDPHTKFLSELLAENRRRLLDVRTNA